MNVEIHPLPPKKNYIMRMCYNEIITNYMIIAGLCNKKKKVSVDQSKYLYYIEVEFILLERPDLSCNQNFTRLQTDKNHSFPIKRVYVNFWIG
jgi:hypothetical protein